MSAIPPNPSMTSPAEPKTHDPVLLRTKLLEKKTELEGYLLRLQVALLRERARVTAELPPEPVAYTPAPPAAVHEKRKRVQKPSFESVAEVSRVDTWKTCTRVVQDLMKHPKGNAFAAPVNPEMLNLPTYFDVIKNPMDLGTVKTRIAQRHYADVDQFAADVQLVFDNAKTFNPRGNVVHGWALELEGIFRKKLASMQRELKSARRELGVEAVEPKPKKARRKSVPSSSSSKHALQPELTLEEKEKLRNDLVSLSQAKVNGIMAICQQSTSLKNVSCHFTSFVLMTCRSPTARGKLSWIST